MPDLRGWDLILFLAGVALLAISVAGLTAHIVA